MSQPGSPPRPLAPGFPIPPPTPRPPKPHLRSQYAVSRVLRYFICGCTEKNRRIGAVVSIDPSGFFCKIEHGTSFGQTCTSIGSSARATAPASPTPRAITMTPRQVMPSPLPRNKACPAAFYPTAISAAELLVRRPAQHSRVSRHAPHHPPPPRPIPPPASPGPRDAFDRRLTPHPDPLHLHRRPRHHRHLPQPNHRHPH